MSAAHLEVTPSGGRSFSFPLESQVITVGRDPSCALVLDDPLLSKVHLRFEYRSGAWFLLDDGSRNGSFISGERLKPGAEHALTNGDVVSLGLTTIRFAAGAAGALSPPVKRIRRSTAEYFGVNDLRGRINDSLFPEAVARMLVTLADDVLPERDPARLFQALLRLTAGALNAERGALFLPNAQGEPALVAEQPASTKLTLEPALYEAILERRGVVLLPGVGLGAGLALPLYWVGGVVGCLLLDRGAVTFDEEAAATSAVLGAVLGPIVARTMQEHEASRTRAAAEHPSSAGVPLKDYMAELERAYVLQVLNEQHGHRTRTAKALGLSRQSLGEKLRKYGVGDGGSDDTNEG